MTNKLQLIAQENGLEPTENLISKFGGYFEEAKLLKEESKEIIVTDENDLDGMARARELRLAIQKIRTKGVEELRKEMKKQQDADKLAKQKDDETRAKKEAKIKADNDAKLEAERLKTQQAEKKLREAKELEEKKQLEEKQEADRKKRLEEEEKRKALLAPDKEKLLTLHDDLLNINMLAVKSKKANDLMVEAQRKITTITDWLYEEVKAL